MRVIGWKIYLSFNQDISYRISCHYPIFSIEILDLILSDKDNEHDVTLECKNWLQEGPKFRVSNESDKMEDTLT